VAILPPVSTTLAKLVEKFFAGVVDTGVLRMSKLGIIFYDFCQKMAAFGVLG
jgi:hypothetical protein